MAFPDSEPTQPFAVRHFNRRCAELEHHHNHLQNMRKTTIKCSQKYKSSALDLVMRFGKKSTIHGMNRLFQDNSNKYERFFWLLVIVLALLGSIYVCLILSQRFNAGSLETVLESTSMPVYRIPFPVVTICNANRLNWKRLDAAKKRFLPHENNTETLRLFELVIGLYDNITFGDLDIFKALENEHVELVNHVNFSLVFEFMTWECEDLLSDCKWRHYGMHCCDIFFRGRSKNGLCWMFNTLTTKEGKRMVEIDPKYPWRTGSEGPTSALTVRVMINPEKHFTASNEKGITVMISGPYVWHTNPYFVPANTETMIDVEPVVYFFDNETKSLTSAERKCVFHNERNSIDFKSLYGFPYTIENCKAECHQEYLNRYCNCTMDLLFPPGQYKTCKVGDLICLARNNDIFRYAHQPGQEEYVHFNYEGMACKCYRSCYSIHYMAYSHPSFLPADVRGNKSYINLDVHFRYSTMLVYRTSLVFGWIDLMMAFGGIAGLFLGCSLISAMELLYFAFVELPAFVYTELKTVEQPNNSQHQANKLQHNYNFQNNAFNKNRHWGLKNRIMTEQN